MRVVQMQMLAAMPTFEDEPPAGAALSLEGCYAAHHDKVLHLGLRYGGGNLAWAEDLTHDVFVKLAEHLPTLHSHDDLGGWLYRVASNLAISRLRRERSFLGRITALLRSDDVGTAGADVVLAERQLADRALAALDRLPPRQRVVLSMKLLDDHSQKDIADILSMSEGYVSKLVARGLAALRRAGWEVES